MTQYRAKPTTVEAITFDEFVEYGKTAAQTLVGGMPWSFHYSGYPVSHENDQCYLITTRQITHRFTPADMLITDGEGGIAIYNKDLFEAAYEKVEP